MPFEISNGQLYVTVNATGAEMKSLRDSHGTEYIWPGDTVYWSRSAPVLFPVVGALRGDAYTYGGKRYSLGKHGFAGQTDFRKAGGRSDAVTLQTESSAETRACYPFDFRLRVEYSLRDFSLTTGFFVENTGGVPMPFAIGGHPGFRVPLASGESAAEYRLRFERPETAACPAITPDSLLDSEHTRPVLQNTDVLPIEGSFDRDDTLVFEALRSRSVELYSVKSGRGVRLDFGGFDYLAVWRPGAAPFVCLEPWTGTGTRLCEGDRLEDKRGTRILPPGETAEYRYTITVL